ncbi:purine-nucleoside phosphorylase [Pseudalkalibacillus salsuginis]|uniref:purine-nucleoside phosphorylase n=1 Tax=Pseudalkalibacillus salsuginis TaxID=2910972 RepID=UPI001F2C9E43|nr:purine-nucleoside phosphorylase [Pseudalkalibacillus salsuginis]MCF6408305.1 purine-nucleoside phosphorylase [Pseudalkalibacillus salsuginis]
MSELGSKIREAVKYITDQTEHKPSIGLILGSGLGDFAEEIEEATKINYSEIPHFPVSTVEGHAGKLVIGTMSGKTVVAMQGRFHFYEGYSLQQVTFPVRVMKGLGVGQMIVTNACGGMNPDFEAGDLMIIEDHLNLTGANPLIGPNENELGPRFPDMSTAYTPEMIELVKSVANEEGITLQQGVYASISGPAYMTRAELKMLRTLGSDTVGMSTVPEVIVARHMDMKTLGISCITDMAIPEELEPLSHEQVVEVANRTKPKFKQLLRSVIEKV